MVVDRFSRWFNVFKSKDGGDGGTTYMSAKIQSFLNSYKVHQRVFSVGSPHGNTRVEIAVKSDKATGASKRS